MFGIWLLLGQALGQAPILTPPLTQASYTSSFQAQTIPIHPIPETPYRVPIDHPPIHRVQPCFRQPPQPYYLPHSNPLAHNPNFYRHLLPHYCIPPLQPLYNIHPNCQITIIGPPSELIRSFLPQVILSVTRSYIRYKIRLT